MNNQSNKQFAIATARTTTTINI